MDSKGSFYCCVGSQLLWARLPEDGKFVSFIFAIHIVSDPVLPYNRSSVNCRRKERREGREGRGKRGRIMRKGEREEDWKGGEKEGGKGGRREGGKAPIAMLLIFPNSRA